MHARGQACAVPGFLSDFFSRAAWNESGGGVAHLQGDDLRAHLGETMCAWILAWISQGVLE